MNRDIKFRAWNKSYSYMINFDNCKNGIEYRCGELTVSTGWDSYDNPTYEGDDSHIEVMQYTGLKDKNGVEIYEGDIVSMHQFLFDWSEVKKVISGVIGWDEYGLTLKQIRNEFIEEYYGYGEGEGELPLDSFYGLHEDSWTVLGNIHENPELLNDSSD